MVGGSLGTVRVKNKEGIIPKLFLIFGILLIIIGIVNLFINYNSIIYSIILFVIGIYILLIGYALRKYGQLTIPDIFLGSRYYEK